MNLRINAKALSNTLNNAVRALPGKSSIPILHNVLLNASGDTLTLTATDLEMAIVATVKATVSAPGSIAVPGKLLLDLVSSYKADAVMKLDVKKETLFVSADGGQRSQMRGNTGEEFPLIPTPKDGTVALDLTAGALRRALNQVAYAALEDQTRPVLNAVNLHLTNGRLDLAGVDGFRMALTTIDVPDAPSGEWSINLPLKTAIELAKLLDESETPIRILADANRLRLELPDVVVTSSLVVGTYPDVRQFLPTTFALSATFDRRELDSATRVARLFADRNKLSAVKLTIGEGGVGVSGAGDTGQTEGLVSAKVEGIGYLAAYNVFILADALNAISAERITYRGNSPVAPALLTGEGETAVHLMMPMHLNGS